MENLMSIWNLLWKENDRMIHKMVFLLLLFLMSQREQKWIWLSLLLAVTWGLHTSTNAWELTRNTDPCILPWSLTSELALQQNSQEAGGNEGVDLQTERLAQVPAGCGGLNQLLTCMATLFIQHPHWIVYRLVYIYSVPGTGTTIGTQVCPKGWRSWRRKYMHLSPDLGGRRLG
jgi:hypothetical protein